MIRLFIYSKSNGVLLYEDSGVVEHVIHDLGEDKDFTLTAPPNYEQPWYWIDDKWTTTP